MAEPAYWLLKTEPETYGFTQLLADKRTNWNGVRNFQARNNLRKIAKGDLALIYHSGDAKAVVGIAKVVREGYVDPDVEGGDWTQVDIAPVAAFVREVSLKEIKSTKALETLPLIKQSRLSVMPLSGEHFTMLVEMSKSRK